MTGKGVVLIVICMFWCLALVSAVTIGLDESGKVEDSLGKLRNVTVLKISSESNAKISADGMKLDVEEGKAYQVNNEFEIFVNQIMLRKDGRKVESVELNDFDYLYFDGIHEYTAKNSSGDELEVRVTYIGGAGTEIQIGEENVKANEREYVNSSGLWFYIDGLTNPKYLGDRGIVKVGFIEGGIIATNVIKNESSVNETTCLGCLSGGNCVAYGDVNESIFCSKTGSFAEKKESGVECVDNFECKNDACINGKCESEGFWASIVSWFKSLFG